jgi:Fe2+ transport system protein FeoA
MPAPSHRYDEDCSLAALHKGDRGTVSRVLLDDAQVGDEAGATVVMRLIEIGFVPGESVEVVAEVRPGGDPIAVRVGGSCFALRRREAQAVMVRVAAARAPV